MPEALFPVFEIPVIISSSPTAEKKYKQSVDFSFEQGDFVRDGAYKMVLASGRETYMQWCLKAVYTERNTRLAYRSDIGVEMDDAKKQADREAVESAIERTITEALMVNPLTEYIRMFEFAWDADAIYVTFVVKGQSWEERQLSVFY